MKNAKQLIIGLIVAGSAWSFQVEGMGSWNPWARANAQRARAEVLSILAAEAVAQGADTPNTGQRNLFCAAENRDRLSIESAREGYLLGLTSFAAFGAQGAQAAQAVTGAPVPVAAPVVVDVVDAVDADMTPSRASAPADDADQAAGVSDASVVASEVGSVAQQQECVGCLGARHGRQACPFYGQRK